jgi:hypothetical protein
VFLNFRFALPLISNQKTKTMKKTIFLSIAMAFVTMATFAQEQNSGAPRQPRGTAEERAKRNADHINAVATLSTDQYAKVLEISKNFVAQRDALKASGATGDDMRDKFKALGKQEEEQLRKVLTPEQMEKVTAAKRDHEGHKAE